MDPSPSRRRTRSPIADILARALAPAAILFLFAALSLGTSYVIGTLCVIKPEPLEFDYNATVICGTPLPALLTALIAVLVVAMLAGRLIGVNKASMHAMYRNRLIRAYLGASRGRAIRIPSLDSIRTTIWRCSCSVPNFCG